MRKDCYIIIVTYNGMQWIDTCLKSTKGYPVIVIDNNSTDGTTDFIKDKFPDVLLTCQKENLGFGKANNLGIRKALELGCEAVFLLNQDAYLMPDTILLLSKASNKFPNYGILSPIHLDGTGERLDENFTNFMKNTPDISFQSDAVMGKLSGIYNIPFINAAAWFVPKRTIDSVGYFDSLFFHYGEDENYCQRIHHHNLTVGVLSNCWALHDRSNRKSKVVLPYSRDYLKKLKIEFYLDYANVNRRMAYADFLPLLIQDAIKSIFKLKFRKGFFYLKLLIKQIAWYKKATTSRELNMTAYNKRNLQTSK